VEQAKQMGMKLAHQLEEEKKMHAECGEMKEDFANANVNWKVKDYWPLDSGDVILG
jgi:hypothetical protein